MPCSVASTALARSRPSATAASWSPTARSWHPSPVGGPEPCGIGSHCPTRFRKVRRAAYRLCRYQVRLPSVRCVLGLLVVAAVAAGGCGASTGTGGPSGGTGGSTLSPSLAQALKIAPPLQAGATYSFSFTDWAKIEASVGAALAASSTPDQVNAFYAKID